MKLAVVGSQSFDDYEYLKKMLQYHPCTMIVSGGAKGADTLAVKYAAENNIPKKEFLPNWNLDGKSAGAIRNKLIVDLCDELVAFWNKKSPGTRISIRFAEDANKPVYIYWPEPEDFMEGIGI